MLQITLEKPGRFARRDNAPEPQLEPGEALVRVRRIGVCGTDLHAFGGRQPFFEYPRILGHELGVEIVDPGNATDRLRPGDRCAVEPYLNCGRCAACRRGKPNCCVSLRVLGVHIDGGMRPLIAIPADKLHPSPKLDYDQLALVETLCIGAHAVERAAPTPKDFVLVIGAGPIGLSVIPFALATGARVAVFDLSSERLNVCRDLYPDATTVSPISDLAAALRQVGDDELPDIVMDATGNLKSMAATFDLVGHGGRIVFVGLFQGELAFDDPNFHRRELTLLASRNAPPATFRHVIARIESGQLDPRRWITHRLELESVPESFPKLVGAPGLVKAMISA